MPTATFTSSIPAVVDALLDMFRAATFPPGASGAAVEVLDSYPQAFDREMVIVGDTKEPNAGQQNWAALGNLARDEDYVVDLQIFALAPGQATARDARIRAFAIFAVCEAALRGNPTLGLGLTAGVWATEIRQPLHQAITGSEGRACHIQSGVHAQVRI